MKPSSKNTKNSPETQTLDPSSDIGRKLLPLLSPMNSPMPSTKVWIPDLCIPSLDDIHNSLRISKMRSEDIAEHGRPCIVFLDPIWSTPFEPMKTTNSERMFKKLLEELKESLFPVLDVESSSEPKDPSYSDTKKE